MKVFCERLKEERLHCQLSRAEMAERLGIPKRTYAHYESLGNDKRQPPLEVIADIARVLDVSLDYLFGLID